MGNSSQCVLLSVLVPICVNTSCWSMRLDSSLIIGSHLFCFCWSMSCLSVQEERPVWYSRAVVVSKWLLKKKKNCRSILPIRRFGICRFNSTWVPNLGEGPSLSSWTWLEAPLGHIQDALWGPGRLCLMLLRHLPGSVLRFRDVTRWHWPHGASFGCDQKMLLVMSMDLGSAWTSKFIMTDCNTFVWVIVVLTIVLGTYFQLTSELLLLFSR